MSAAQCSVLSAQLSVEEVALGRTLRSAETLRRSFSSTITILG